MCQEVIKSLHLVPKPWAAQRGCEGPKNLQTASVRCIQPRETQPRVLPGVISQHRQTDGVISQHRQIQNTQLEDLMVVCIAGRGDKDVHMGGGHVLT